MTNIHRLSLVAAMHAPCVGHTLVEMRGLPDGDLIPTKLLAPFLSAHTSSLVMLDVPCLLTGMDDIDINALGQAMDTTWGRSSTPRTNSFSVKMRFLNDAAIEVRYAVIVNFVNERQMIELKRSYTTEADSVISATVKHLKEVYKELTGNALKAQVRKDSESDSIEIINMSVHTARRSAYFRRAVVVEVG